MCDTLVATQSATKDNSIILAKNSDREPEEAQILKYFPKAQYIDGQILKCTYVFIPAVKETNAILISKPFWMWGCEMGVNEYGLAIGNEAVFTKEPVERSGLLGMDLIRISLERCKKSYDALMLTTELIERYGQGGNAGMHHKLFYHNSFIFADKNEAYLLETANKCWVALKINGVRSISNGLTIEEEFEFSSPNIEDYARKKGYIKKGETFNFKKTFSDKFYTYFSKCSTRQKRSMELLEKNKGEITPKIMMEILRDHGHRQNNLHGNKKATESNIFINDNIITPDRTDMGSICMHSSLLPTRPSQSVASLVAHIRGNNPTYWSTGSSAPCVSIFMPFYLKEGESLDFDYFPSYESLRYDEKSYWWLHEKLHRKAIFKYNYYIKNIKPKIMTLENDFINNDNLLSENKAQYKDLVNFSKDCVNKVLKDTKLWIEEITNAFEEKTSFFFKNRWKKLKLN